MGGLLALIPLGILPLAFAVGKLLDAYTSPLAKKLLLDQITNSRELRWHQFIAERSLQLYCLVFDTRSSTKKFIIRSTIVYFILFSIGLVFIYALFPHTFLAVTSVWSDGRPVEIASWIVCVLLGAPIYTLANAQTLYFLEILRTSPTPFKFIIVAYADFLITASITIFSIPALFLLQTATVTGLTDKDIIVKVDFNRMLRSPVADMASILDASIRRSDIIDIVKKADEYVWLQISYEITEDDESRKVSESDYKLLSQGIKNGLYEGLAVSKDGNSINSLDDSGIAYGFRERNMSFSGLETSYRPIKNRSIESRIEKFCEEVSLNIGKSRGFIDVELSPTTRSRLVKACKNGDSVELPLMVRYRYDNIDFGELYRQYVYQTVGGFLEELSDPMSTYLQLSPVAFLSRTEGGIWEATVAKKTDQFEAEVALDDAILKSRIWSDGGYYAVRTKSIPGGTINFAVMSTALFSMTVMLLYFFAFPLIKIAQRSDFINRYIELDENPFTLTFVFLGFVLTLFAGVSSLLI